MDLSRGRLYGILDLGYVDAIDCERVATAMMDGGVDLIQLRAKRKSPDEITELAQRLHVVTRRRAIPLVINDHPEIARAAGAEGVHLGQDDISISEARARAGAGAFIGKSTHSLSQAKAAVAEGADYIGFGPLFATPTKPDYAPTGLTEIRAVHEAVPRPIFCIGGIKLENLAAVIAAGARRVVIVSGLLRAEDIASYARAARNLLEIS